MRKKKNVPPELGKWALWKFFGKDQAIRSYLPSTAILDKSSLRSYLTKYRVVYIKPSAGSQGKGVVKAWQSGKNYLFVKGRGVPVVSHTVDELYKKIRDYEGDRMCIIQKAIDLAEIQGRPFDIRLMMMRDENWKWTYVGTSVKVAGPTSIITNLARGRGYITDIDSALGRSLGVSQERANAIKKELIQLGYITCKRFTDYKFYTQVGLDVAVDKQGKVWMIEQNTAPAHSLFAKLKDQSAFKRIKRLSHFYWKCRQKRRSSRIEHGGSARRHFDMDG